MFDPNKIKFASLTLDDLPTLHKWLNEPHVHAWYDKHENNTFERVEGKYGKYIRGEEAVWGFIVEYSGKPVAYIQYYIAGNWKEFVETTGFGMESAGVDLFIGEKEFMGKGFGSIMLKKFISEVLFVKPEIEVCLIDPEPENARAIRSYEKVGFKHIKTIKIPKHEDVMYLMKLRKADLFLNGD